MKLQIKGINVNNEDSIDGILGISGFCGSIKYNSMTEAYIDLGTKQHLKEIGIEWREVESMMSEMLLAGFELKITQ
jgi:hypothetical protein